MNKQLPLALLGLAVCAGADAAAYRLAFSKGENVEVFVDHADNQPWCANPLALRFAFSGKPDSDAVARLLPKLGGLLASQCPTATTLTWKSFNAQGQWAANGAAAKADEWTSHVAGAPAVPVTEVTAEPAPTPAAAPAPPPVVALPPPPEPVPVPEPPKPSAPAPVTTVTPAFAVSGWTPPAEADVLKAATFFFEIKDQNGCLFRTTYQPQGDAQYVGAKSTGVTCGNDGYASGEGRLQLTRADGVNLKDYQGSFHHGVPFNSQAPQLPIVGFDDQKNAVMLLASDPASRVHYLLRAAYNWGGFWDLRSPMLIAITENQELFRQVDSIHATLFNGLNSLDQIQPKTPNVAFIALRDLQQGLFKGDRNAWLYEVNVGRNWSTKAWDFNPQYAHNYLFIHEAQVAEQQRMADQQRQREEQNKREQAAYQAQDQLQQFARLKTESRDPKQVQAHLLKDVSYAPTSGGSYARLVAGGNADYSQIVHIDGKTDGRWETDYPYESQLDIVGASFKPEKGWFLAKGKVTVDPAKRDSEDLPLTLVAVTYLQACAEDGCTDLRDPLKIMRMQLGDDAWTPDAARQVFKQAWPDRAILGDAQ